MTVIAWDGKTLAADKLAETAGLRRTTTKVHRIRDHLVATAGDAAQGVELRQWFEDGADPTKLPAFQLTDDFVAMLVITPDAGILKYERSAYPIRFEDGHFAIGSGRDYAIAAMYLGHSAVKAVDVASQFCTGCGNGCDWLDLVVDVWPSIDTNRWT